jgi:hypothetical protein
MSKHTPGPWTAISDPLHFYSLTTIIAGNVLRGIPQVRIDVGGKADIAELETNAFLIAAAPELLEALETLERLAGLPSMQDDPARVKARAVIAKARGQE